MKEKELELIANHRAIEELIRENMIKTYYAEQDEKIELENKIKNLISEKDRIEKDLKSLPECPITLRKVDSVKSVLGLIIKNIDINKGGLRISGNQGMIYDNWLFGQIIYDIRSTFDFDYGGYPIPEYLYEQGGKFDSSELNDLLLTIQKELSNSDFRNYVEFKKFIDDNLEKIRILSLKKC